MAGENGITGSVAATPEPEPDANPEAEEQPDDPRFAAAYDAIEAGDWAAAADAYRAVLTEHPGDADAIAGIALCEIQVRLDAGLEAGALRDADLEAAAGDWATAFAALLAQVKATTGDERDIARERLLSFFAVAGDDPAVPAARLATCWCRRWAPTACWPSTTRSPACG